VFGDFGSLQKKTKEQKIRQMLEILHFLFFQGFPYKHKLLNIFSLAMVHSNMRVCT